MSDWIPDWSRRPPQPEDGVVALSEGHVLRPADGWLLPWSEVQPCLAEGMEPVFAGRLGEQRVYVTEVAADRLPEHREAPHLREVLLNHDPTPATMIGTAAQVLQWWRDHRYCGRCGQLTGYHPAERARWCEACDIPWYARLAPCVIVVIRRGDEFLLARSSRVKRHFFSLIAGFVEPGESAEQAVAREVHEETGLSVTNIRYQNSQPWPFPHQLMLGYFADYTGGELVLQEDELAEAGWFRPGDLPPVPPHTTIAGRLISAMEDEIRRGEGIS